MADEIYRPKYTVATTQNAGGKMPENVHQVWVDRTESEKSGAEIVSECQFPGQGSANWVIDRDGEIYELAGWDRTSLVHADAFYVKMVTDPEAPMSEEQIKAYSWLMGQLARKRGVDSTA